MTDGIAVTEGVPSTAPDLAVGLIVKIIEGATVFPASEPGLFEDVGIIEGATIFSASGPGLFEDVGIIEGATVFPVPGPGLFEDTG